MLSRASLLCRRSTARRPAATAATSSKRWLSQAHTVSYFATSHQSTSSPLSSCATSSIFSNHSPPSHQPHQPHQQTQTRSFAGRHDRASTSTQVRPPTKKQRKKYHARQREQAYEKDKHSRPNSKASARRLEDKETQARLIDIAQEEEMLKGQLGQYFNKVNEIQDKIEQNPKFQALLKEGKVPPEEIQAAARTAAKAAAEKSSTPHPPLPSWWQDRMTYDWGDALIDDLMGNSADLTSSPSPYPVFMGGEYGRLRRKVERMIRGRREEEKFLMEGGSSSPSSASPSVNNLMNELATSSSSEVAASNQTQQQLPDIQRPTNNILSDKLISDLIRSHRDANGKRTTPLGLAPSLQMLQELQVPLSALGTYSYVSLLTCCKSPFEGRKLDDLRKEGGVRSNSYFWSALVDVYARSGDYRGAEQVLDEMLDESQDEYNDRTSTFTKNDTPDGKVPPPIATPPLAAYTSFFSSCHKLISRPDVHQSIKSDAASRAWARWKEMRIHSVAPDVMAYGSLMRIFAAQGRAESAIDLLDEVMMQMMMPVNASNVLNKSGDAEEILKSVEGDDDGWYDDQKGETSRVKPTTLLFTSALKAVSKSHEIATKFNGALSKKNRRRETATSYHGRLTRKIVVLAEQAEVKQDDGFIAALMLCAAAAGDSSTARAIYLASKVRQLDHLRTCGGGDHLRRLQGLIPEDEKRELLGGGKAGDGDSPSSTASLAAGGASTKAPALTQEEEFARDHSAYEHREYGTDTRILSTLLLAHSKAMESQGLGSMWSGRYNRGYLCPNSLRYIEAYNRPQMENMAIPGVNSVEAGLSPEGWEAEDFHDEESGKSSKTLRKKHKFNIKSIMDDGHGNRKDDQDGFFDKFDDVDPDDIRREERLQLNGAGGGEKEVDASRDWLNDTLFEKDDRMLELQSSSEGLSTVDYMPEKDTAGDGVMSGGNSLDYGNDFDSDSDDDDSDSDDDVEERSGFKAFKEPQTDREALVQAMAEVTDDLELAEDLIPKDLDLSPPGFDDGDIEGDNGYFDEDAFNKLMMDTEEGIDDSKGGDAEELDAVPGVSTNDFAAFTTHLKKELLEEGASHDVDETEARQLFDMMRTYYDESNTASPDANLFGSDDMVSDSGDILTSDHKSAEISESSFNSMTIDDTPVDRSFLNGTTFNAPAQNQSEGPTPEMQRSTTTSTGMQNETIYADDYIEWANSQAETVGSNKTAAFSETFLEGEMSQVEEPNPVIDVPLPRQHLSPLAKEEEEDPHILELQQTLPGLPLNRIEKVSDEFARTLGYPSILRLTLAVRENMPEAFSPQCLTRVNLANAKFVMMEAEKEGLVDAHLLNGMLRVHTNSGRIEPALRFYDTEYKKHGLTPTTHSDRLLLEMLVKKKRIARAFKLKQDIEKDGRSLDLLCYGSLVDHFGRHQQLGSALLLIKECISVHGSPPGEKSLRNIRLMCRQNGLTDKVGLEKMAGKDPLEWMRRGEELKRVQNKRGKSSALQYGMNRMLDI
mmetsp:Transcript_20024/g.43386  ORF Transcript_20024/g.43386 Transcript_20024/m.43386 type:complete len:1495 (+) Transcript_20024:183-4667(+)